MLNLDVGWLVDWLILAYTLWNLIYELIASRAAAFEWFRMRSNHLHQLRNISGNRDEFGERLQCSEQMLFRWFFTEELKQRHCQFNRNVIKYLKIFNMKTATLNEYAFNLSFSLHKRNWIAYDCWMVYFCWCVIVCVV